MTKAITIQQKRVNADKQAFFTEFYQLLEKYNVDFDVDVDIGDCGDGVVNGIDYNFNTIKDKNGDIIRFSDSHLIRGEYQNSSNYVVDIKDRI